MKIEFSEDEQEAVLLAIGCMLHSLRKDSEIIGGGYGASEKIKAEQVRFETLRTKIFTAKESEKC